MAQRTACLRGLQRVNDKVLKAGNQPLIEMKIFFPLQSYYNSLPSLKT